MTPLSVGEWETLHDLLQRARPEIEQNILSGRTIIILEGEEDAKRVEQCILDSVDNTIKIVAHEAFHPLPPEWRHGEWKHGDDPPHL